MGVCIAGPVDVATGVVLEARTMAGWHNVPLRAWLEERTGLPVTLANDLGGW